MKREDREEPNLIILTGIMAAGKSTIGCLLAKRFRKGVFIEAYSLQEMIVSSGAWVSKEQADNLP